jgi:hypothetical protein
MSEQKIYVHLTDMHDVYRYVRDKSIIRAVSHHGHLGEPFMVLIRSFKIEEAELINEDGSRLFSYKINFENKQTAVLELTWSEYWQIYKDDQKLKAIQYDYK